MLENSKNAKSEKPKYGMWRCVGFMLATAWRERELASPLWGLVIALAAVGSNLVGLYLPPAVVRGVEGGVSPGQLLPPSGFLPWGPWPAPPSGPMRWKISSFPTSPSARPFWIC